jgi:uncharacterized protein YrrD
VASTYGAAGSVVLLLVWVYYSAQIFPLGAEFTRSYAYQLGSLSAARRRARLRTTLSAEAIERVCLAGTNSDVPQPSKLLPSKELEDANGVGVDGMLRRLAEFQGSRVLALDGETGKVRDAFFDEEGWIVRYLTVDTGGWLSGRKVLIDPRSVALIDRTLRTVWVSLSRARIESSPSIDLDEPVSRQHELQLNHYYGYNSDWTRSMPWGTGPLPPAMVPVAADSGELEERGLTATPQPDTHLRSVREVLEFTLITVDGRVGAIKDVFFDDETWALRYLIVQRGSWLLRRRVLVNADQVRRVSWAAHRVEVNQTRKQLEQGREFDADHPPPGDFESALQRRAGGQASRQ